jgi:hypothetical protein
MTFKFVVRTEAAEYAEDPQEFESHDSCADLMRVFCVQEGQPYSEPFVSIEISVNDSSDSADDNSEDEFEITFDDQNGGSEQRSQDLSVFRTADSYGELEITLGAHVLDELQVISAGDYQNIVCRLAARKLEGLEYQSDMRDRICDLSKIHSRQERDQRIMDFIAKAQEYSRLGYAEGRIFRRLRKSDKGAA